MITLVQIRFLKTLYFGQQNEYGTQIDPIMRLNTLSLRVWMAYKQFLGPRYFGQQNECVKERKKGT